MATRQRQDSSGIVTNAFTLTTRLEALVADGDWTEIEVLLPAFDAACRGAATGTEQQQLLDGVTRVIEAACRERGAIARERAAHRQRGRALDAYAQTDEQAGLDPRLS